VDAGLLIGFLDHDDQWHDWNLRTSEILDELLATTEAVVAEVCDKLRKLRPALGLIPRLVTEKRLSLVPAFAGQLQRMDELVAKYPEMAVGDAMLVVLSELFSRAELITVDKDFPRYRRLRNQAIPLVMPEKL
jgi:predicted nucleic acid-binding protein